MAKDYIHGLINKTLSYIHIKNVFPLFGKIMFIFMCSEYSGKPQIIS